MFIHFTGPFTKSVQFCSRQSAFDNPDYYPPPYCTPSQEIFTMWRERVKWTCLIILWSTHTYKYSELVKDAPMTTWQKKTSHLICKGLLGFWCVCYIHDQTQTLRGGLGKFLVACFIIRGSVISLTTRMPQLQRQSFLNQLTDRWFHHEWEWSENGGNFSRQTGTGMGRRRTPGGGNSAISGELFSVDTPEKRALEAGTQMEQSTLVREPGRMPDLHLFLW